MKKTKFSIEIHSNGSFNEAIIQMITNHNSGLVEVSFSTISGFIHGKFAQYPTITPITTINTSFPNQTMEIIEMDKHTLTLTLKELHELDNGAEEAPTVFLNEPEGIANPNFDECIN